MDTKKETALAVTGGLIGACAGVLFFGIAGKPTPPHPNAGTTIDLSALHKKLDTVISNQHTLYRAITNHDHYVREWTRPVEF